MNEAGFRMVFEPAWLTFALLLIPYLLWGVYLLKLHLNKQIDINPVIEGVTILAVAAFFTYEFYVLEVWLAKNKLALTLATLSLLMSGVALYGPTAVSLITYLVTEMLMPRGSPLPNEPKYGHAEGMETRGDFEGAAAEYMAVARMFPKEPKPALRAADNLMKVERIPEAAEWFHRGLALLKTAEQSLPVVNRLYDIYARKMGRQDKAREVLERFLERFSGGEYADSVRARLERLRREGHDDPGSRRDTAHDVLPGAELPDDEEPTEETGPGEDPVALPGLEPQDDSPGHPRGGDADLM